ncbi:MAG TPA: putative transporter [Ignavibacteriales bacterium]|nr:putative transporter [Ignavibacteriales bacterium]HOL80528.1 putative transporter [Ignavibacteriales bacterium]HOM64217.1 putative transporter [Ignavibacteriales bacterium]HPD67310.1 putative transporter [Ignavibacteriales bacterium]HPP33136.1 putative transporter [Ignavibacteriales bacterium]
MDIYTFFNDPVSYSIVIFCSIIALGVLLGRIKIFGISFGVTFVLFVGIIFAHYGIQIEKNILNFAKNFGLIIFIYSLGLQLGANFFDSFKKDGIKYNILALIAVSLYGLMFLIIQFITKVDFSLLLGIMTGAVMSTATMAASQQAILNINPNDTYNFINIGVGYAIAYPFASLTTITGIILARKLFKVNIQEEAKKYELEHQDLNIETATFIVTNPVIFDKKISYLRQVIGPNVVVVKIKRNDEIFIPNPNTQLKEGDLLFCNFEVTYKKKLMNLIGLFGYEDIQKETGKLTQRKVLVTNREVIGKYLSELNVIRLFNVSFTAIQRNNMEFIPNAKTILYFGDIVKVIGDENAVNSVCNFLGNSQKRLFEPNLIPIFAGIILGLLLGYTPIYLPGLAVPIKLGIAGGTLLVAMIISKFTVRFGIVSYMTPGANYMLRQIGLVLFLAAIGLSVGNSFFTNLLSLNGLKLISYGIMINMVSILTTATIGRYLFKLNFLELSGLMAGFVTDSCTLAYATSQHDSDAIGISFATIYPLINFTVIVLGQILISIYY